MTFKRKSGLALLAALVVVLTAGAARNPDIFFLIKKNFTIFSEVYREVSLGYVDEVDPEKLMRRGIDSMLETLDPYTVFIDESRNQEMEIISRGSYGGVGLDVGFRGEEVVVIAPADGYSAERQGMRTGDVILEVDGIPVGGLSPEEIQGMTTGEPGSEVSITVRRYGMDDPITFQLTRERIEVKNVTYHGRVGPEGEVGYIRLARFSQNAGDEVRSAIQSLREEGALSGLILDLRNNPGGLLGEAVSIVDKFTGPGEKIVETRGRLEEHNNIFRTSEPALEGELPLVVLQNEGSASASEIVAGALQDLDRAVIVGERSFGKGLVQIVKPLSYNTAIKITTSRYFIPSGRSIQSLDYSRDEAEGAVQRPDSLRRTFQTRNGRTVYDGEGIAPDISVPEPDPTVLETALMQQNRFFHFANRYASEHNDLPTGDREQQVWRDFREWLREQEFDFRTPAGEYLSMVDSTVAGDKASHISALEQLVEEQKERYFVDQEEELRQILLGEIMLRYRNQRERIANSLTGDPVVERALSLIAGSEEYNRILGKN